MVLRTPTYSEGDAVWVTITSYRRPGVVISDVGRNKVSVMLEGETETREVRISCVEARGPRPKVRLLADDEIEAVAQRMTEAGAAMKKRTAPLEALRVPDALRAQPKQGIERSKEHLAVVRSMPCAWCNAEPPSDPHHAIGLGTKGVAVKASDYHVIPLCRVDHDTYHASGAIGFMNPEQTKWWVMSTIIRLLAKRLETYDEEG